MSETAKLAAEYMLAKQALSAAQAEEREARDRLVESCYPNGVPEGTKHVFADVYDIETTVRPEVKIVDQVALKAAASLLQSDGEIGPAIVERLITYKAEVKVGEFRQLPDTYTSIFAGVLALQLTKPTVKVTRL